MSPIYQGTISVFHHHIYPPLFPPSSPLGNRSSETWPFKCVVTDKVTAQLYVPFLCVCVFSPADVRTTKTKEDEEQLSYLSSPRSHPSELDLTLEDGCGPVVHALTPDGSKALLLCSLEEWLDSLGILYGRQGWDSGDRWFCPLVLTDISLRDCICVLWPL